MSTVIKRIYDDDDDDDDEYSVKFNAIKSKSMLFIAKGKGNRHQTARPNFCI